MDAVVIDPPADVLARRSALGLDIRDEVWDGEYHMVPAASYEHQRIESRLLRALGPSCDAAGLDIVPECNLIPPDEPGWDNFRVPDLVICGPEHNGDRAAVGAVSLVVEIRSPDDESFEKLGFYEQLGVGEVVIIDRDTKVIRRWANGADGLVESAADESGRHALVCIPVQIWSDEGRIHVRAGDQQTVI